MSVSKTKLLTIAAGTFLMMLCSGIVNNSTTYFILPVTEFLGCSTTTFSLYFTIITACSAMMSLVVGPIAAKIGVRISALIACAGVGTGFFIMSRLQALWMVYLGAVFIGIFQTFVVVPTVSVINAWFSKNAGTVTGIAMSATGFGGLMMGIIMPHVVASFSWRTGYLIIFCLWVAITLLVSILVGGKPPVQENADGQSSKEKAEKGDDYKRVISSPVFWIVMLCALINAGVTMITQHMSVLLEINGMSLTMISFIIGVMTLALALCKIAEGALADKIPVRIMFPGLMIIGAIGYTCLSMHSTPFLLAGVVGESCASASCTVLFPVILRSLYGEETGAHVWGICWAAFMAGHAIFTPLYARIYDMTGSYTPGLYMAAVLLLAVGAFITIQLKKKSK